MVLTWWIILNYFFMVLNFILPYVLSSHCIGKHRVTLLTWGTYTVFEIVEISILLFTVYTFLFECFFVCFLNSKMELSSNCCFYMVKLASGCLRRLMVIMHAVVAALMLESDTRLGRDIGIILTTLLCMSQFLPMWLTCRSMNLLRSEILANTERN